MNILKLFFISGLLFLISCCSGKNGSDTVYKPFSSSVIHLQFDKSPQDTLHLESHFLANIPLDASRSELLTVIKKGDFYLNLETDRPNTAALRISQNLFNIFVFPNDTTHIIVKEDMEGFDLSFSGKGAEINQYYTEKKQFLQYQDIRNPLNQFLTSETTYNKIKHTTDSVVSKELSFLDNYPEKEHLPEWFIYFEKAEITYSGAGFKVIMPGYNKNFNWFHDSLPENYFNFLKGLKINNTEALLSGKYLLFLDDYFGRNFPYDSLEGLSGFSRNNVIKNMRIRESSKSLTREVKNIYYKYLLSTSLPFYSDSSEIDSLARAYGVSDYHDLLKISGYKTKRVLPDYQLTAGDTIPNFYVIDEKDSLVSIRDYQDKIIYINFWATWCGPCLKNIPQLNKLISETDHQETVFLNVCLESQKDKWKPTLTRHQLKGINLFAAGNWSKKLAAYFDIKGIPQYVLIDKGNILVENHTDKAPMAKSKINKLIEVTTQNKKNSKSGKPE